MTAPSSELPAGLEDAFAAAAGELGMATTAWLFVRAVARAAGDDAVATLAERLGQEFTPLDSIAPTIMAWVANPDSGSWH